MGVQPGIERIFYPRTAAFVLGLWASVLWHPAHADDDDEPQAASSSANTEDADSRTSAASNDDGVEFVAPERKAEKQDFTVGLAPALVYSHSLEGKIVGRASVDQQRIVRVDLDYTNRLRLGFEGHVTPWHSGPFNFGVSVTLVPGPQLIEQPVDGVGVGLLAGIGAAGEVINLSFGAMVDFKSAKLGEGLYKDKPLPENDVLRLESSSRFAIYATLSWTLWRR